MDALTVLSLAGTIITFIDFAKEVVTATIDIHASLSGTTEEDHITEMVVGRMEKFSAQLLTPDASNILARDQPLCMLANECRRISEKILKLLQHSKAQKPTSKRQALVSAFRGRLSRPDVEELEKRLDRCRKQFAVQLWHVTR